jgi:hypothetical protein
VNFAKVRSAPAIRAIVPSVALAAVALAALAGTPPGAPAQSAGAEADADPRVIIAVLPYGVPVEVIGRINGIAPGIMSAALGSAPPAQSFLDIGQGNRVNQRLYDSEVLSLYVRDGHLDPRVWDRISDRAEDAPANVIPGLMSSTLKDAGLAATSEPDDGLAPVIAADRNGEITLASATACAPDCPPGMSVVRADFRELDDLVAALDEDDLLIAFAAGARSEQPLWPTGVAGEGFNGNLTSDSTRTDGVVLATDVAPTVLEWLGVETPNEMNGSPIRSEGERDPEQVADLRAKLGDRPSRETVGLLPLAGWLLLAGAAALAFRGRVARTSLALFGLACAWAPTMLLAAAAIDASEPASALIVAAGAVVAAATTYVLVPGLGGLALACAVTVGVHAVDVIAGSPYTSLSVLGPNPGGGVRFFGIGNELEAILTTLTIVGTGAWLSTRPAMTPRRAAGWFLGIAAVAALAFAPGRFGADVGAAIVLGVGGAAAAVLALGIERRKAIALVLGGGAVALATLFAIDLILGGAHLSRSVLGAGEAGDLADVLERRVSLMVSTFTDPVYPELLIAAVVLLAAGFWRREAVLGWFGQAWPARCGFLGATCGVLLGTLANDSGSVLLVLGTIYLGAAAACVWGMNLDQRAE